MNRTQSLSGGAGLLGTKYVIEEMAAMTRESTENWEEEWVSSVWGEQRKL